MDGTNRNPACDIRRTSVNARERFEQELNHPLYDEKYKETMKSLSEEELEEAFYRDVAFGTAGIRQKMGVGPNRLHNYTIRKVSYALSEYVNTLSDEPSVAIGYDSRNNSLEFSKEAARTLASHGVQVYLYRDYASTPELSFAVRELKTTAGVVITASHNPKEYNGYKVYHESGRQVLEDEAEAILRFYENCKDLSCIETKDFDELLEEGKIQWIKESLIEAYDDAVFKTLVDDTLKDHAKELSVVYSALHGTGYRGVRKALKRFGIEKFYPVETQIEPDGNFPEVAVPNPEDPEVFKKALELGRKNQADILMATDPDADRIGCMVLHEGEYQLINGNEMGTLMVNYLLKKGRRGKVITTVVSSLLIDHMKDLEVVRTLTGFKYIGEEMNKGEEFLLGFEESYGYLNGTHVRDKDAISAALLITEMATDAKLHGRTLVDELHEIFKTHGYYEESQLAITLSGREGQEQIKQILDDFRETPLQKLQEKKLIKSTDFSVDDTGLPQSNVIKWVFEDDYWVALRPSGTEPKLKIYMGVTGSTKEEAAKNLKWVEADMKEKF